MPRRRLLLNLLGFVRKAAPPIDPRLFYDTFTDADGTALTAHTPDIDTVGGGWVAGVSGLQIASNRCVPPTTGEHLNYFNTGVSNVRVGVDGGRATGNSIIAVIVRYIDNNNYWILRHNSTTRKLEVFEKTGGAFTLRAEAAQDFDTNTTYALTIEASTSAVSVAVQDGASAAYASTTHNAGTRQGIRARDSATTSFFDNFEVAEL